MIRFLKALVLLPIAIIVILLAVANRGPVLLSLDPFSQEIPEIAFKVPLYAVIFASVMVGVVIGGIAAWLAQRPNRQERRRKYLYGECLESRGWVRNYEGQGFKGR